MGTPFSLKNCQKKEKKKQKKNENNSDVSKGN